MHVCSTAGPETSEVHCVSPTARAGGRQVIMSGQPSSIKTPALGTLKSKHYRQRKRPPTLQHAAAYPHGEIPHPPKGRIRTVWNCMLGLWHHGWNSYLGGPSLAKKNYSACYGALETRAAAGRLQAGLASRALQLTRHTLRISAWVCCIPSSWPAKSCRRCVS